MDFFSARFKVSHGMNIAWFHDDSLQIACMESITDVSRCMNIACFRSESLHKYVYCLHKVCGFAAYPSTKRFL